MKMMRVNDLDCIGYYMNSNIFKNLIMLIIREISFRE